MNWYDDLCEYYNVTPEEAIDLGTKKKDKNGNRITRTYKRFPGSRTCKEIKNGNFDDVWDKEDRNTLADKMKFYKDLGSYMVFRQCSYRKSFDYADLFYKYLKKDCSILEYGCGVAPFTNYMIENKWYENRSLNFSLVDVGGEHMEFAKWRLGKKINEDFKFYEITADNLLPNFNINFDIICLMDVLEHLPNPFDVINNIYNHCNKGAILVYTWVDGKTENGRADLEEAEEEREITMNFIKNNFEFLQESRVSICRKK